MHFTMASHLLPFTCVLIAFWRLVNRCLLGQDLRIMKNVEGSGMRDRHSPGTATEDWQTPSAVVMASVGDAVGRCVFPGRSTGLGLATGTFRRLIQFAPLSGGFKNVSGTVKTVSPIKDLADSISSVANPELDKAVDNLSQADEHLLVAAVHFWPDSQTTPPQVHG